MDSCVIDRSVYLLMLKVDHDRSTNNRCGVNNSFPVPPVTALGYPKQTNR
jgi:hypothetical protein